MRKSKKAALPEFAGPIVHVVEFPLAHARGRQACHEAMAKAEAAVHFARAQMACLDLADFFKANPNVVQATFSGDWEGDDEGGEDFWLNAELEFSDGSEAWNPVLSERLCSIFEAWKKQLDGQVWDSVDGVAQAGNLLMGDGYAKWRADLERMELDMAAEKSKSEAQEAARL